MHIRRFLFVTAMIALALVPIVASSQGRPPLPIGVLFTFSTIGPAAAAFDAGVAAYQKAHGKTAGGREIVLFRRDDGGPNPENSRRLAQEFIVQDHVAAITGISSTPNAIAVAGVSTAAKVPAIVTNAANSNLTRDNPYTTRTDFTTPQLAAPLAEWAAQNSIRTVYIIAVELGSGYDAASAFTKTFTAHGGSIVGSVHVPLTGTDFTSYLQRARDARPGAVFVFVPSVGSLPYQFVRAYSQSGLSSLGTKLLATNDLVDENYLPQLGDTAIGIISAGNYSSVHDSAENRQFTALVRSVAPAGVEPDFTSVAIYDALDVIYRVANELHGEMDPDKAMALIRGMRLNSPRGPVVIDPETHDIVQNVYIRRTERRGAKLVNREIATFPLVKDPGP